MCMAESVLYGGTGRYRSRRARASESRVARADVGDDSLDLGPIGEIDRGARGVDDQLVGEVARELIGVGQEQRL